MFASRSGEGEGGIDVDELHSVLRGERAGDILLGEHALLNERIDYAASAGGVAGFVDLSLGKQADIFEHFNDKIFVVGHEAGGISITRLRKLQKKVNVRTS